MTLGELITHLQGMRAAGLDRDTGVLIGLGDKHSSLLTDVGVYVASDGRPIIIVESSGHSTGLIGVDAQGKSA